MGAGRWLSAIIYLGACRRLVRTMFVLCPRTYCLLECVCVFAHISSLSVHMEELVWSSVCICGHIWINYQFSLQFCSHKTCRKLLNIDCVLPIFGGGFSRFDIFSADRKNILPFLVSTPILPQKAIVDLNDLFHKDKMPQRCRDPNMSPKKNGWRVYLWKRGLLENRLRLSQLGCTAVPSQQVLPSSLHISEKMKCICKHGKQIGIKSAKMHLPRIKATLSESSSSYSEYMK